MPMRSILLTAVVLALGACTRTATPSPSREGDGDVPKRADAKNDEPHTRCKSDDDCMLSCIEPGDCCGAPPFCDQARHRKDNERIEATRTHCDGFDYSTCPQKDYTVPDHVAIPTCRLGRCVAKKEKRQPPPDPIDVSGYDHACKTVDDCVMVETQPCSKCGCPGTPISAHERDRFAEAKGAVTCPPYDLWPNVQCGSCMSPTLACEQGSCVTHKP